VKILISKLILPTASLEKTALSKALRYW